MCRWGEGEGGLIFFSFLFISCFILPCGYSVLSSLGLCVSVSGRFQLVIKNAIRIEGCKRLGSKDFFFLISFVNLYICLFIYFTVCVYSIVK